MKVYLEKMDSTPNHVRDVYRPVFQGTPTFRKNFIVIPYHFIFDVLKIPQSMPLTLLLLTLIITYFRFSRSKYTPSVLANQNYGFVPNSNDL